MNTDNTRTKHKKSFYKLKRFYIPILILLVLFVLCAILLYRPIKLIYWGEIQYPKKQQELDYILKNIFNAPNKYLESLKTNVVDNNKEFDIIYSYLETAERDFIIARFFGLDKQYLGTLMFAIHIDTKLITLSDLFVYFFTEESVFQVEYIDKIKNIHSIAFENIVTYFKNNLHFNNQIYIFIIHSMRVGFYGTILVSPRVCYIKDKIQYFKYMQESYDELINLKANEELNQSINNNFGSYDKMIYKFSKIIEYSKEKLNACKR